MSNNIFYINFSMKKISFSVPISTLSRASFLTISYIMQKDSKQEL